MSSFHGDFILKTYLLSQMKQRSGYQNWNKEKFVLK